MPPRVPKMPPMVPPHLTRLNHLERRLNRDPIDIPPTQRLPPRGHDRFVHRHLVENDVVPGIEQRQYGRPHPREHPPARLAVVRHDPRLPVRISHRLLPEPRTGSAPMTAPVRREHVVEVVEPDQQIRLRQHELQLLRRTRLPSTRRTDQADQPARRGIALRLQRHACHLLTDATHHRAPMITLQFHPDWPYQGGTVIESMVADGIYRSQFSTGSSNGGLTAYAGGDRWRWESRLFAGRYDDAPAADRPVYGAWNRRADPYGGAVRFGSSY